jgi:hypothetical protein
MSSYTELHDLIDNPLFHKRVQFAIWRAATDVLNDSNASAQRKTWARNMLRGNLDLDERRRVSLRCLMNPAVASQGANAADADVQFVVNGLVAELSA